MIPMSESKLRLLMYLSFPNISFIFNNHKLSKDYMRLIVSQLDFKNRYFLEQLIVDAATIVKVLTTEFLYNCITYLEDDLVLYYKDRIEELHALVKFKYRYLYQQSPEYKVRLNRKFITLSDQSTLDFWLY